MKIILFTLLFSLVLTAMDISDIQKSYELLNSETVENGAINDVATTGLIMSLILGLASVYFIVKNIHVRRKNRENQMLIKDLEDEVTNLKSQISYIQLKNKTLVEEVDEKVLHFANENQTLTEKNKSNKVLVEELNEKINKAVKEKDDLFRQIEETIIFN